MKQIIVNVSGLTIEEKQRVNKALAKITGFDKMNYNLVRAKLMYAPSSYIGDEITYCDGSEPSVIKEPTHTPQQVLEMAGMAKQGHVHAENMALYAEDAKTTDKPWELWQVKDKDGVWWGCKNNPLWGGDTEYRRKPKTHIVNGVEVPDLRFDPAPCDEYYAPLPTYMKNSLPCTFIGSADDNHRLNNNLCYESTDAGKQAAILHAKAWLGIA